MKDAVTTIGNLLDKQSVVFISSLDKGGYPNTKAMLTLRKRDGIKTFYFHTNTSSMRILQYKSNPQACIYFCDKRFFKGAMLSVQWRCWRTENIKKCFDSRVTRCTIQKA